MIEHDFPGTSEMARRMRAFDWPLSPLGVPSEWPQSLKTTVRIMLAARQPMAIWWGEHYIHLYNDPCAAFLRPAHPATLGAPAEAAWPENWHKLAANVEFARQRGEGAGGNEALPVTFVHDGKPVEAYLTFTFTPIPDDRGGIGGVLCVLCDETRRIRAQRRAEGWNAERSQLLEQLAEQQESRDLLDALVQAQAVSLSAFKAIRDDTGMIVDFEYTFANDVAKRMAYGLDLVGMRYTAVYPGADEQGMLSALREVIETGEMLDREFSYSDRSTSGWFRCIAVKLGDGIVLNVEDVTERRRAEDARRQAVAQAEGGDRLLHAVMEHIPLGIGITGGPPDFPIVWSSRHGMEMTGRPTTTLKDLPSGSHQANWGIFLPDGATVPQQEQMPLYRASRLGEQVTNARFVVRTADQRMIDVLVDAAPIWDDQGNIVAALNCWRDITELQRAERVRERLLEELRQAHAQLVLLSRQLIDAQEKERRAIARELHDEIGQSLTGLKILLDMALRLPTDPGAVKIELAQDLIGELIDRVNRLSLNLRPPMLDDLGLLPALLWWIKDYTVTTGVTVDFSHVGLQNRRVALDVETAAYRVIQASLTNVALHAQTNKATLRVTGDEHSLRLEIDDKGRGFDLHVLNSQTEAHGLRGLRERVRLLGGEAEIKSAPGRGTHITVYLSLHEEPRV